MTIKLEENSVSIEIINDIIRCERVEAIERIVKEAIRKLGLEDDLYLYEGVNYATIYTSEDITTVTIYKEEGAVSHFDDLIDDILQAV